MKNNRFVRFAPAFFIFGHSADVLVLSTTWNDLFCSCEDDVSTIWQKFNSVLLSLKRWFQFNSWIVRTHFATMMTLNNSEMTAETRSYIYRWRSRCCQRRVCVNSLLSVWFRFYSSDNKINNKFITSKYFSDVSIRYDECRPEKDLKRFGNIHAAREVPAKVRGRRDILRIQEKNKIKQKIKEWRDWEKTRWGFWTLPYPLVYIKLWRKITACKIQYKTKGGEGRLNNYCFGCKTTFFISQ